MELRTRRAAVQSLSRLPRASPLILQKKKDMCAICCEEMRFEARVTPCNHFFHGGCLKKWLSVKQVKIFRFAARAWFVFEILLYCAVYCRMDRSQRSLRIVK